MVNLENKLTVDDLIVEYMIYKVENGYESKFTESEFMNFLYFFEKEIKVEDSLYEKEKLFKRFFERKAKNDWEYPENQKKSHMEIEYSKNDNDYVISANYRLSYFDRSVITPYFMPKSEKEKITNRIGKYLSNQTKRKIDESTDVKQEDLIIGKYISAEIIRQIWLSYIDKQIEYKIWPKQCKDINKYLFETDLAKIIGTTSIKDELINLYNVLSKRIAILYQQDRNLKVTSYDGSYLAKANYDLLIKDFESLIGIAFGPVKKSMKFDLALLTFTNCNYNTYNSATTTITNDNVKKLVKNIENSSKKFI